jgi:glucokinase
MAEQGRRRYLGAVDLGGTKILSVIADEEGRILGEDRRPTEPTEGPEAGLERIATSLEAALANADLGREDLLAAGVCSPGPIDRARGVLPEASNLPGWIDVPIRQYLSDRLGVPAILEHDATAAAYGEFVYGAGRGCRNIVYLTVSTGIGGGLVLDGRLYRGATGAAGELGHITIEADGPLCFCGKPGHVEGLTSGRAIAGQAEAVLSRGGSPVMARLAQEDGGLTAATVHRAADAGDGEAIRILRRAGRYLGIGLAAYVDIFNPEVIIIGGGMRHIREHYLGPAEEEMRRRAQTESLKVVRLVEVELGDYSGIMGVVALLREGAATA